MSASAFPSPESTPFFEPDPLLHDLLAVSLTAINLLRPCYSPTGELNDFAPEYFNPAAQRMTGLPERPVGTARTLFPDIFGNGIFAFYRQVFETGEPDQFHLYYQADGLDNYFRIAARRSGERLLVSFTDTADQSRTPAENALRDSQAREQAARAEAEAERQRFQDVLMQLPAQVAINRGPDHVFTLVNAPYQQMFPTRPVQGLPVRQALPELEGQQFFDLLDRVYQTGEPFYSRAMPAFVDFSNTGNMEQRYVDVFFQALHDVQGRVDGILNFSYDVTEQVLARQQVEQLNQELEARVQQRTVELAASNEELLVTNEELHKSNAQLTRTNVDLDTFVYTASHDLKAPITNIESIVLALRDTLPTDVQQDELVAHLLNLLNQTVTRFRFTIGQLTDISRLQLAHAGPAEPVELAAVVESVRLDLVPALTAAGTQLTVEVAPDLVVSFSPSNLRSVVYNLLSNAIKYHAPDRPSEVRAHAKQTGKHIVLTVQDNGLGMSEVQQRQLFGLFQRLHTHVEGTGVGLYITKRLVENAGGTIQVQSEAGIGTTFTITFPA